MNEVITDRNNIIDARILQSRAESWVNDNPDAWGYMVDIALRETESMRHFSMQWLVEEARKKAFIPRSGELFKINNSFRPVFARMLIRDYPEMRPYIETRRSKMDAVM